MAGYSRIWSRARSSEARTSPLQGEGHRFESGRAHTSFEIPDLSPDLREKIRVHVTNLGTENSSAPVVQWLRFGLAKAATRVQIPAGALQSKRQAAF